MTASRLKLAMCTGILLLVAATCLAGCGRGRIRSGPQTSQDIVPTSTMADEVVEPVPTWTPTPVQIAASAPAATPDAPVDLPSGDPSFEDWNDLEPQSWWRASQPYSCTPSPNPASPWVGAGLLDLGGSDPLSLIRYYGNGSYLRYGHMGFMGCTPMVRYPDRTHLDPPADPTYYSLGDLEIWVDIARVPTDAEGWFMDDGTRIAMSLEEAVALLNAHVAPYYRQMSEGALRITFRGGFDFQVAGNGTVQAVEEQWLGLVVEPGCCDLGQPGGLNRLLFNDVANDSGGDAYNGFAHLGLVSLREANMETIVHEIGHGWMGWPHSYTELLWEPVLGDELQPPNPYSNPFDMMSALRIGVPVLGWRQDLPPTLAINRYSAGWIAPEAVALHLSDNGVYRLNPPLVSGHQFLVVHSGRPHAFTTLEVLPARPLDYVDEWPQAYDASVPGHRRPLRYEGVLVSRYDQTTGTGVNARLGPALYNPANETFLHDVGWGRDDYSLIGDGGTREIGSGVTVAVSRMDDGSYEVEVRGGKVAEFRPWCIPIWFSAEYDTGCLLATMSQ